MPSNSLFYNLNLQVKKQLLLKYNPNEMGTDSSSEELIIIESINIAITILFLVLFSYRFYYLGSFSRTNLYKNYFPKLRIFFCLIYVVLSLSLLIYNLATDSYPIDKWYNYILQGGGGECINSIILLIQLGVLRLELNKQQPYTPFHIAYFVYLCVISIVRLIFTFLDFIQTNNTVVNLSISVLFVVDSVVQLGYWMAKKQSLPQFQQSQAIEHDFLQHESKLISRRHSETSQWRSKNDNFPYIIPLVVIQDSRIRIGLQVRNTRQSNIKDEEVNRSTNKSNMLQNPFVSPFLSTNGRNDISHSRQLLSFSFYSIEQIQQFYSTCGRFPLKKKLEFPQNISLTTLVKSLQQFLGQLFREKRYYQKNILEALNVPVNRIQEYGQLVEKATQMNHESDVDRTIGLKLLDDKNSIYCSILVYRQLWVSDHYEFYIKVVIKSTSKHSYAYKRYSQFEEHHQALKQTLKLLGLSIELPALPKKHLFGWNEDREIGQRRIALQKYLKRLCNDCVLMQEPAVRQKILEFLCLKSEVQIVPSYQIDFYQGLKVVKGQIHKTLIVGEYVTQYTFKITRNEKEIRQIVKRFSEIEDLHYEIQRWMRNIQTTNRTLILPEKVYYKSESHRQQKLTNYIQSVVETIDIGKVYAANVFFNIHWNAVMEQEGSEVHVASPRRGEGSKNQVLDQVIELANHSPIFSDSQSSSRRFSQVMNDLGNEEFD